MRVSAAPCTAGGGPCSACGALGATLGARQPILNGELASTRRADRVSQRIFGRCMKPRSGTLNTTAS